MLYITGAREAPGRSKKMTTIETIEVDGFEFEIVRKENGALAAFCHGEEQCKITEGCDYRRQIDGFIEGAY